MAKRNLSLKLLVDKKNQKVLFAEAGKEVVDFLFSLLALPVGTAARLLSAKGMVGSVGKLYDSVVRMDATYMQSGFDKNTLLEPSISSNSSCHSTFLLECSDSPSAKRYYRCSHGGYTECNKNVTDGEGVLCPRCKNSMTLQMTYVPPKPELVVAGDGGGYVKGVATYMVMDDLSVVPMSTIQHHPPQQVPHQGSWFIGRTDHRVGDGGGIKAVEGFLPIQNCPHGCVPGENGFLKMAVIQHARHVYGGRSPLLRVEKI